MEKLFDELRRRHATQLPEEKKEGAVRPCEKEEPEEFFHPDFDTVKRYLKQRQR